MAKGLSPMAVWGLARELKFAAQETRPLLVSGALSEQLAKELSRRRGARRRPRRRPCRGRCLPDPDPRRRAQ